MQLCHPNPAARHYFLSSLSADTVISLQIFCVLFVILTVFGGQTLTQSTAAVPAGSVQEHVSLLCHVQYNFTCFTGCLLCKYHCFFCLMFWIWVSSNEPPKKKFISFIWWVSELSFHPSTSIAAPVISWPSCAKTVKHVKCWLPLIGGVCRQELWGSDSAIQHWGLHLGRLLGLK